DHAVRDARAELVRLEMSMRPEVRLSEPNLLRRVLRSLDSRTAVFAFLLGNADSWLWVVDSAGITLHQLAPAGEITSAVDSLDQATRDDAAGATHEGDRLYSLLFGKLGARVRRKPRWLLALAAGLFRAPLAALPERLAHRAYLAESHAIQVIPGLAVLCHSQPARIGNGWFVGVGDPIYNAADPRYAHPT